MLQPATPLPMPARAPCPCSDTPSPNASPHAALRISGLIDPSFERLQTLSGSVLQPREALSTTIIALSVQRYCGYYLGNYIGKPLFHLSFSIS